MLLTLHNPNQATQYYANGAWTKDTLYSLLVKHAIERPEAFGLRDARHRLSWRHLRRWVDAVAAHLHQVGLRRGDRVAVWLPSRVEGAIVLLACSRNGYVCCPSLHQNYTVAEITSLLERSRARALFMQPGYGADGTNTNVIAQAKALPLMREIYAVGQSHLDAAQFPDAATAVPIHLAPDLDPDKIIYLAYTSGTTGSPKGVMHSDNTLLANGRAMVKDWHHNEHTVLATLSPLSHHIATVAIEQQMAAGFELVLNDPPDGMKPIDWIVATGATYVMGVPTHAIDMLAEMKRRQWEALGKVKLFYMAGAPIPRDVAQGFLDRGITPQNIYGMTENGSHQYTRPSDDAATIVETCGRAAHGYECAIFDAEHPDRELAPGAVGEIATRGALLMLGYYDNQAATEDSFNAAGWFFSGDLGVMDARGCLRFVGRKKDLIIRGGHNIHPARIEDLAHRHVQVLKAAVFGVPDERLGEKVCLAVIGRGGASPRADDLLAHLHQVGLSKYDMPEYFVVMDAFPLTPSGKILKRELIEWVNAGQLTPEPVRWVGPLGETH